MCSGLRDVAGIQPQAVHAGIEGSQRHLVLVVDVGDDRNRRAGDDLGQTLGRREVVARAPHDVGAGGGKRVDLGEGAVDIGRLGGGHRLHGDGRTATDGNRTDHDLAGRAPRESRDDVHQMMGSVMSRYSAARPTEISTNTTAYTMGRSLLTSA